MSITEGDCTPSDNLMIAITCCVHNEKILYGYEFMVQLRIKCMPINPNEQQDKTKFIADAEILNPTCSFQSIA